MESGERNWRIAWPTSLSREISRMISDYAIAAITRRAAIQSITSQVRRPTTWPTAQLRAEQKVEKSTPRKLTANEATSTQRRTPTDHLEETSDGAERANANTTETSKHNTDKEQHHENL